MAVKGNSFRSVPPGATAEDREVSGKHIPSPTLPAIKKPSGTMFRSGWWPGPKKASSKNDFNKFNSEGSII